MQEVWLNAVKMAPHARLPPGTAQIGGDTPGTQRAAGLHRTEC